MPFDLSHTDIFLTVQYIHRSIADSKGEWTGLAAVDEPLPTRLCITRTHLWDQASARQDDSTPVEFCYEVDASADVWLIGGQRRGRFQSQVRLSSDVPTRVPMLTERMSRWENSITSTSSCCHRQRVTCRIPP